MSIATLEKPKNRRRNGAFPLPAPPPLLNGDHLAVPEFERRYWAMPEIKKPDEKKAVYQRCLVPEYFVRQVMDWRIRWFALEQGDSVELKPRSDGVIRSRIFPGLWLDVRALVAGDEDKVSRTLERGIKSAERAAFVKRLAGAK